jgi:acyl-CoA reductase-like NAD-dependent aldehyde dehydrogenase
MTNYPRIAGIFFPGAAAMGKRVMAAAALALEWVILELCVRILPLQYSTSMN